MASDTLDFVRDTVDPLREWLAEVMWWRVGTPVRECLSPEEIAACEEAGKVFPGDEGAGEWLHFQLTRAVWLTARVDAALVWLEVNVGVDFARRFETALREFAATLPTMDTIASLPGPEMELHDYLGRVADAVSQKTSTAKGVNSVNIQKLFPEGVPENSDIVDLAVRLDAERGSGKSDREIAREFTNETPEHWPKANSLLSQIGRMKRDERVNL